MQENKFIIIIFSWSLLFAEIPFGYTGYSVITISISFQNEEFRDWILEKLIQAEQACHRVPSFARLHVSIGEKEKGNLILITGIVQMFSASS